MELEEAIKIIQKRLDRLMEEFKIEKEEMNDEPRIAYLMQEIRASKTVLHYIKEECIPRALVEEVINKQIEIIRNENEQIYYAENVTDVILEDILQEILTKGE